MNRCALFDYGFRPFFLLCGVYALAIIPVWLFRFAHAATPFGALPAMYWHSHEMLYGFVMAAVAGFLLTAVPSWTGARGFAGRPLMFVVILWILGRVAMSTVGSVPFWLTASAELALLPAFCCLLAPPIFRSANRNAPLLVVVGVLWLIDVAFLLGLHRGDAALAGGAMRLAIDLVLILVTVIGGRIVPAFTANALRQRGESVSTVTYRPLEIAVIGAMIAIAITDVFAPDSIVEWFAGRIAALAHASGSVAGAVSGRAANRFSGCCTWATPGCPWAWRSRRPRCSRRRLGHEMAARADRGRLCHHDPRRDDACVTRSYRPATRGVARDRGSPIYCSRSARRCVYSASPCFPNTIY